MTASGRCQVQPPGAGGTAARHRSAVGSAQSIDSSENASGAVRSNQPGVNSAARSDAIVSRVGTAAATEVDHRRSAVERHDALPPQEMQQVGVVGVAEEGLRVRSDQPSVEVWHDRDLVVAADDREDGLDVRVGERGGDVAGAVGRGRAENPGGRVLDRLQAELVAQPAQSQLVHGRKDLRQTGRRRDHGHPVAGSRLGRILPYG